MEFIMNEVKVDEIAILEDTETPNSFEFGSHFHPIAYGLKIGCA